MSVVGILIALGLLVWLAYRGWSILLLAPLCALIAALLAGQPLLANWTQTFMSNAAGFVAQFFPIFLLGALFGKLMEASGSVEAIAKYLTERLGTKRAMLAIVLAGAFVTYGGVSLFVAFFVLAPMGHALFKAANIPHRLMPAAIALGTSTFTMSLVADASRYQTLYGAAVAWLEDQGVSVAGLWADHFNTAWLLRAARQVTGRVNTTLSFWLIALVYIMLGLLEVDDVRRKVQALKNQDAARILIDATAATAVKFRKYMLVRTQMSVVTGLLVWGLAWVTGLQFAAEWGVIAFVLNYIPFIGPFIATLFPTLVEMTQFSTWQAVLGIFAGLNLIQFVVGSYIEPRVSGDVLSISPFVVLFAVFFWTFMWGLFGAFIGVPIVIAILTFCSYHPRSRFIADLLGGPVKAVGSPNRNP
jgi:AI-2 transport protein TqsA